MSPYKKLKRVQERSFSAHHMLIRSASRAYESVEKETPGYMYDMLAVITFSALGIEALCNSIGERMIPNWGDFETAPPIAKLRILCRELGIEYDPTMAPWSDARSVMKFRNRLVHAKPEQVVEEVILTQEEHDNRLFDVPESKLEKAITPGNAKRALQAVETIKGILISKVPTEKAVGLFVDGWSGSTTLHEQA